MRKTRSAKWIPLISRYIKYRKRPFWGAMITTPNGRGILAPGHIERQLAGGRQAAERLKHTLRKLRIDPKFPERPGGFSQKTMDRILRKRLIRKEHLGTLWEALVFDRDDYTCQYCGRNAREMWRQSGRRRTLRLVVDHQHPRTKRGDSHTFANSVTACWTCNALKGPLPLGAFRQELKSLVESVLRLQVQPQSKKKPAR